jgi:hypothetical protein
MLYYFILFYYYTNFVTCIQWNYKYSQTSSLQQQLTISCGNNDQIWIGWSHYGTRLISTTTTTTIPQKQLSSLQQQQNDFPTVNM